MLNLQGLRTGKMPHCLVGKPNMQTAAKKFQLVNSNTPFPQLASGWQQTRHAYGMDLSRN